MSISEQVLAIDGRQVRVRYQDGAGTLVVLASGCALGAEIWHKLEPLLPGAHLSFDRPGLGGTVWPGHLPQLDEEVGLLRGLIEHFSADRPVVLAAHSMAGFHAEALVRRHPGLVSGLVMVDASVERSSSPLRLLPGTALALGAQHRAFAGLEPLLGHPWRARHHGPQARAAVVAEWLGYYDQAVDLIRLRAELPWPDRATIVLTAKPRFAPGRWLSTQAEYASVLGAQHRIVTSGHNIMVDRPHMVADAIAAVRD